MSRKSREFRDTVRPTPCGYRDAPQPVFVVCDEVTPIRMCARCGRRPATDGYAWCDQCRVETRDAHLRNAARGVFPEEPF